MRVVSVWVPIVQCHSLEKCLAVCLSLHSPLSLGVKLATRMLCLGCLLAAEIFRDEKVSLFDTLPGLCKTGNDHDLGIQF